MVDYVVLKQTGAARVPASLRAPVLKALGGTTLPASSGLPRYLREGLVFPYAAGARLVNAIQERGGWAAVDRAFGKDGPASSEQIIHPGKYFAHEPPRRIRVPAPSGSELVQQGDFGEFDTEQLLLEANARPVAETAAAGWDGGGYALWRRGDRYGVTLRWSWDGPRDAAEFARALRRTGRHLGARASGSVLTVSR